MNNQQRIELSKALDKLSLEQRADLYRKAEDLFNQNKIRTTVSEYVYGELYINKKSPYYITHKL
jgi:hypothetical protein